MSATSTPPQTNSSAETATKPSPSRKAPSITIVIPTLGRPSLKEAVNSCGNLPVKVQKDNNRKGAGPTRNRGIRDVKTEWVGFLDDDDTLTYDYYQKFTEALKESPDCIIFRMRYPDGRVLPKVPQVIYGNVGISVAVKTELARKYPFVKGANEFQQNEDYQFVKQLEDNGANIYFSPHITYLVKPSKQAQENANINNL